MITVADLQTIFSAEIQSDVTPIVYRKYTTDEIPAYTVRLSNSSDMVYIEVYAQIPEYVTITNPTTTQTMTSEQGILLAPLDIVDVLVTFNPSGIDISSDSNPNIVFQLQALEYSTTTTSDDSTTTTTTTTTSTPNTPATGGGIIRRRYA